MGISHTYILSRYWYGYASMDHYLHLTYAEQ